MRKNLTLLTPGLALVAALATGSEAGPDTPAAGAVAATRAVVVAIDSLNPAYLGMDATASGPGGIDPVTGEDRGWLMPNVRTFVRLAAHWPNARGHAPHATDMNHLNVLAATHTGLTGIEGVAYQPSEWSPWSMTLERTLLSNAQYPDGAPVKTLFDLFHQAHPGSTTAFFANKGWVAANFGPTVDLRVTGDTYAYFGLPEPTLVSFFDDPASDEDAACDPESDAQRKIDEYMAEAGPESHPRDAWIVDAAAAVMGAARTDFAYILLGDLDHGQHTLGSVADPTEWVEGPEPVLPPGCEMRPTYRQVSKRNPHLIKEPILDLIRDVDTQFGRLVYWLTRHPSHAGVPIVLVSDHGMVNQLWRDLPDGTDFQSYTDIEKVLLDAGVVDAHSVYVYGASGMAGVFFRPYVSDDTVGRAKAVLRAHTTPNPAQGGASEAPWHVLGRAEMLLGRPDLGLKAGELFHYHSVAQKVWPDLFVFSRNGWAIKSGCFNVGGACEYLWMNAGHGAPDTGAVVIAVLGLGYPAGATCAGEARLADVGMTLDVRLGLPPFPTRADGSPRVVGKELTCAP